MKEATRKRYAHLKQCRSCKHDKNCRCLRLMYRIDTEAIIAWAEDFTWKNGHPQVDADGCPGWETR